MSNVDMLCADSTKDREKDDVPVTGPFLSLVKALHSARTLFISESAMADELGVVRPSDHYTRCRMLFFKQYAEAVAKMGLEANEQTFEALMRLQVPEDAWRIHFDDLPNRFIFNAWAGMGHGGIKVVAHTLHSEPSVAIHPRGAPQSHRSAYAKGLSDAFNIVEEVLETKAENWKLLERIKTRFQEELGLTDQ